MFFCLKNLSQKNVLGLQKQDGNGRLTTSVEFQATGKCEMNMEF